MRRPCARVFGGVWYVYGHTNPGPIPGQRGEASCIASPTASEMGPRLRLAARMPAEGRSKLCVCWIGKATSPLSLPDRSINSRLHVDDSQIHTTPLDRY